MRGEILHLEERSISGYFLNGSGEDRNMKTVYEWKRRMQKIHSYMQ